MDLKSIPKKIQYISLESAYVNGTNSECSITFDYESNVIIEEMKDVIAVRLVDFYITQIGETSTGDGTVAKYIDIICPEIPTPGQILDSRNGKIFARIPIERSFAGSNGVIVHDKQWKGPYSGSNPRFFNPITLKKLTFSINELRGNGVYTALQDDAAWTMVLEIHTVDREAPKPDKLAEAIDKLTSHIKDMPPPQIVMPVPEKSKIPLMYVGIPIAVMAVVVMYFMRNKSPDAPVRIPEATNMMPSIRR